MPERVQQPATELSNKLFNATVLIASLGYLIDMFDMFLYNMNRVKSLTDLGLSGDALTQAGLTISNWQMGGFLVGALIWGITADRFGRKFALFPSILLYSLGSLACAFVQDIQLYGILRFVTALGLAGELGTGVALITEKLNAAKRGYGVITFISLGYIGVIFAGICTETVDWRTAYIIGGIAGLALLLTRTLVGESHLFTTSLSQEASRGNLWLVLKNPQSLGYYVGGILLIATGVFLPQVLWTLSPEIAKAMQVTGTVKASVMIALGMITGIIGNITVIYLSEKWRSRKKATMPFLILGAVSLSIYLIWQPTNLITFYAVNVAMGLVFGIWTITALWAAEHFGTNIRATVASTTPNFARALTIPMNLAYVAFKPWGTVYAISIIGAIVYGLALIGWYLMRETHGRDLNYVE